MSRGRGQQPAPGKEGMLARWQRFLSTWRLRRFLKRKARTPRAVGHSSGLLEWSAREIARLQPSWVRRFIKRQRRLARFFEMLTLATLLAATGFFALSLEWFWVWQSAAQAALREEKQVVTKWEAWHAVKTRPPRPPVKGAPHPASPVRPAPGYPQ